MATSTTVPAIKTLLVDTLTGAAALAGVDISYAWRPWGASDQLFLGDVEGESDIPTMKTGRKARQESYRFDVVCRTVDTDGTPYTADAVELRAYELLAAVDQALADDVQVDGATSIQWARLDDFRSSLVPVPDNKGWGCELVASVSVEARLS